MLGIAPKPKALKVTIASIKCPWLSLVQAMYHQEIILALFQVQFKVVFLL